MNRDDHDELRDSDLVGELFDAIVPQQPPEGLREKVLARVRATNIASGLTTIRSDDAWKPLAPGIDYKMLHYDTGIGSKSFLLRAAAGSRMPPHAHRCYEECLVLEGEFRFGDLALRAGDFHGAAPDAEHGEAYTATGVVVYLRASLQDYPGIEP